MRRSWCANELSGLKYCGQRLPWTRDYDPDFLSNMAAQVLCRDNDLPFDRYMDECGFREISRKVRLVLKTTNTIIEKWPMRLTNNATRTEFLVLQASGHTGSERYVEWRRAE